MSKYELQVDERLLHATEEQEAIIDLALASKENILINALAGAAKTSTLQFLCKYLPVQPILSLAFNKRIAEEMTKRLPGHVKAQTLNSVGHRVWMQVCSKKINLDTKKSYNILKAQIEGLSRADKSEAYEVFSETLRLVSRAKAAGYIPDGIMPHATRLISCEEFWDAAAAEDEELLSSRAMVDTILTEGIKQAYDGTIDFDNQIYMSTLFGGTFPQFPLVMVDEAQDLSALNHAMLKKLAKGRLIAVGDPWQSIYGFRGAVSKGMARLKADFNMTEMNLSVSFRCPIEVVKAAQSRVPHMRWPEWAKPGEVRRLEEWDDRTIVDGAAIICRNNAPLFSLAFKLLQCGRGVSLIGFDIGPSLVKTMKKLGPLTMTQEEVYAAIDEWEKTKLRSAKSEASVRDKADCFRVFASFGKDLATACVFTEDMFKRQGTIQLLSGHKAKGLEWETVYHLDPWRVPSKYAKSDEEIEQELNVRYVIQTRAKNSLFLADLKDFNA
jgi:DNA helicase-2/ATP-dependent DNA helicase PcrA